MIVVLSGNPRPHSRTLHLAEEVGAALAERLNQPVPHTIDVAALGTRLLQSGDGVVADAIGRLRRASLLVIATPTYKGTYTGVLKVLLDQLPAEGLKDVAAVTVVTAGVRPQADATERHLVELLGELGAVPVTPGLAVVESELANAGTAAAEYVATIADGFESAVKA
ncbi:NAD(P)H-dependent oxidoreductase [Dactylosporangium sp. AC04546]|uniref:NADPH-dependent FMN reductase n=1 Tax=Dactylosporangium sp. AC04546 TaxID=2862460 RepID=UPI001EE06FB7|nr:NAD(P)H-dependent oxidoreductase [Dactylosporangium sp. AC04546]WVK85494.1 NAD(P)H-dependent oxidoreductase [Dactylosporangium sp. AC04546]